jgi:hypothetical protein
MLPHDPGFFQATNRTIAFYPKRIQANYMPYINKPFDASAKKMQAS